MWSLSNWTASETRPRELNHHLSFIIGQVKFYEKGKSLLLSHCQHPICQETANVSPISRASSSFPSRSFSSFFEHRSCDFKALDRIPLGQHSATLWERIYYTLRSASDYKPPQTNPTSPLSKLRQNFLVSVRDLATLFDVFHSFSPCDSVDDGSLW